MTTAAIFKVLDELNATLKSIARTPDEMRLYEQELQNAAAQLAEDEDETSRIS